jgi:hypothetical protein
MAIVDQATRSAATTASPPEDVERFLEAAFLLRHAHERLVALRAESRAVARLAAEAMLGGRLDGRGIVDAARTGGTRAVLALIHNAGGPDTR